jgi:hypothetical protein
MIAMIEQALLYKEMYDDAIKNGNQVKAKDYEKFRDAEKYKGW